MIFFRVKMCREKNFCSLVIKQLMVGYTEGCLYHPFPYISSVSLLAQNWQNRFKKWLISYLNEEKYSFIWNKSAEFLTDFPSGQFALYYVVVQGIWGRIVSARFSCAGRTLGIRDWCSL